MVYGQTQYRVFKSSSLDLKIKTLKLASGLPSFFFSFSICSCSFEFLFDIFQELYVSSLYWGEQPALEQGKPFGLLSIVSEQICAFKKVREDWAVDLALPLPQGFLYL